MGADSACWTCASAPRRAAARIAGLDAYLREQTPHIGRWLDTSELTAERAADEIPARAEAAV
ncbi:hypothetical protein G3I59_05385 [Amycolatopsis rubida]|uniref:Uncharacterized protein n=1 Tax=Amycolatopsis rubida TaxID=112413 RepID=A0ABX0BJZ4_9PSEU|nr:MULTISPECIES: hypothetical protein [Amycolatopsis]MYW90066.1 hypothetical protein [Amycolatopsis rubida]NEC55043.1 hypothetical protein [Amycolatopsis rubida]